MLKELKPIKGIKGKDIISVVKRRYPKYDKSLHSKVVHGLETGVTLRQDALDDIDNAFGLDALESRRTHGSDKRRYTRGVRCRLSDDNYGKLQLYKIEDGYKTDQDLLADLIEAYIRRKDRAAGRKARTA